MPDRLLSPDDLAGYLGVPVKTIYRWREHRAGPPGFRVGRHVRYDPADVRAWLDQQRAAARSPAPDLAAAADPVRTGGRRARRTTGAAERSPAGTAAVSTSSRTATKRSPVP